jgi:hypothetical protein
LHQSIASHQSTTPHQSFARSADPSRVTGSAGKSPTPAETSAVMSLLAAHARALLGRDRSAWSVGLDTSASAAAFAEQQRAVFDNLDLVPLTTWRYTLSATDSNPAVITAAGQRLGGRVVIVHVLLGYALAKVDPRPTQKDLWLTAVSRGGAWRLAGDSDAVADGGHSWRGPWDFGPLIVRAWPHALVLAHPSHVADLAAFGELVERSVPVVTRVWGSRWNDHVAVLISDTHAEFAAVTADQGDTRDLAALSVADNVLADGTVLGARIVLNPANLSRLGPADRRLVVQHELAHIAARSVTDDQMPLWVTEGFADFVGNLDSGVSVRQTASELAAEIRRGLVPSSLPSTADFDGGNSRLPQVYQESWLACVLIARRAGQSGLVRFYKAVSIAARTDPRTAAAVGLHTVLHSDIASFTKAWQADLRSELG